jgi:hypothetical protein
LAGLSAIGLGYLHQDVSFKRTILNIPIR